MYWTQTESPVRQSRLGWQGARRSSIALLSGLLDCQYLLSSSKHRGKEQQQRLTVEYCSFIYVFIHVHKWRKKNFFPSSGHKSLNIVQNVWQKSGARHCQAAPEFSWQRIYEERNPTVDETGWGGGQKLPSLHIFWLPRLILPSGGFSWIRNTIVKHLFTLFFLFSSLNTLKDEQKLVCSRERLFMFVGPK